jgi:hypothetical protein
MVGLTRDLIPRCVRRQLERPLSRRENLFSEKWSLDIPAGLRLISAEDVDDNYYDDDCVDDDEDDYYYYYYVDEVCSPDIYSE